MGRILVVGLGSAGLTLPLELHAIGRDRIIFEAAPSIKPLGLGLNLQPYAVAILHRIGPQRRSKMLRYNLPVAFTLAVEGRYCIDSRSVSPQASHVRSTRFTARRCMASCSTRCGPEWEETPSSSIDVASTSPMMVGPCEAQHDASLWGGRPHEADYTTGRCCGSINLHRAQMIPFFAKLPPSKSPSMLWRRSPLGNRIDRAHLRGASDPPQCNRMKEVSPTL
jgi:hypothetical protein